MGSHLTRPESCEQLFFFAEPKEVEKILKYMEVDGLSVRGIYIILETFQMFLYKVIFKDLVTFKDHVFFLFSDLCRFWG